MALRTLTDQESVDKVTSREAPVSAACIATGDYKSVDPPPAEFTLPINARIVTVYINFTAQSGAGNTVTTTIEGWDKASSTWVVLAAPAADATGGAHAKTYVLNPEKATADPIFGVAPWETMRVKCVGSGTRTTLNYSVGTHFST
jgi:hypothetical protein